MAAQGSLYPVLVLQRRDFLLGLPAFAAGGDKTVDSHIHLFDPARFPYHANGTYQPAPAPLEPYLDFIRSSKIDHVVIVHPEPYQDDHRYLEYCFAQERPAKLFKGTCLFDPLDKGTPARMAELVRRNPNRIVALRIHAMNGPGKPFERSGPVKNRDLGDPQMKKAWAAAGKLGLAIQMHFLPHHAPAIGKLAAEFADVAVILDHMGRAGQGSPADADGVLKLADRARVYFKFSGVRYSSRQEHPYRDAKPFVRRALAAFGADRILWGGLGHSTKEHAEACRVFEAMFGDLHAADAAKIRGLNAIKLFRC
jgi:predicted TIM-barrel fold metal-dependent hydrolase